MTSSTRFLYDLFAPIEYDNREYEMKQGEGKSSRLSQVPLCHVVDQLYGEKRSFRLLLWGGASLGKSTQLSTVKLYLLKKKIPFLYLNLKILNGGDQDRFINFKNSVAALPQGSIVLLDSYDELNHKELNEEVDRFIFANSNSALQNISLLLACRWYDEKTAEEKFKSFQLAHIQELNENQVSLLLAQWLDSEQLEAVKNNGHYDVLKITMFLRIFLDLLQERVDKEAQNALIEEYSNETWFFDQYFHKLYAQKTNRESAKEECEEQLTKIGEYFLSHRKGEAFTISDVFNNIFYVQDDIIQASHELYRYYAEAKFLYRRMQEKYRDSLLDEAVTPYKPLLKADSISHYFLGQLAKRGEEKNCDKGFYRFIVELFISSKEYQSKHTKSDDFMDLCWNYAPFPSPSPPGFEAGEFYLGYNDDIIDDGLLECGDLGRIPVGERGIGACKYVAGKIKAFMWCGKTDIHKIVEWLDIHQSYLSNLQRINVIENKRYVSIDNCLIDLKHRTLCVIGADAKFDDSWNDFCTEISVLSIGLLMYKGRILKLPQAVVRLGQFSLCGPNVTEIHFSKNVKQIDEMALSNCWHLNSLYVDEENERYFSSGNCVIDRESKSLLIGCIGSEIPADGSVTHICHHAFSHCDGITELKIPDGVKSIAEQSIIACRSLKKISIGKDVENISPWSFCYNLALEEIEVSPKNEFYKVETGCLIEIKTKRLITCLRNGIIPNDGSVRTYNRYSFLNDLDLGKKHVIPVGIEEEET